MDDDELDWEDDAGWDDAEEERDQQGGECRKGGDENMTLSMVWGVFNGHCRVSGAELLHTICFLCGGHGVVWCGVVYVGIGNKHCC